MEETIDDHQHPDITHTVFIGGPYTDRFLTKKQKRNGERSKYYVDTKADVKGEEKVVRTEFTRLFTANAFIKRLRESGKVKMEEAESLAEAEILLQGRLPEDDRRLKEHNEEVLVENLRKAFKDKKDSKEEIFHILKYHLKKPRIILRERIDVIPSYIKLK